MEVSHSLKSLWQVSALMASTMRSRVGIQLVARWQFCRQTHCPFSIPPSNTFSAYNATPRLLCDAQQQAAMCKLLTVSLRGTGMIL